MKRFKCENCGGELTQNGDSYSCSFCHATYRDDSIEKAYNRVYANLTSTVKELITEELVKERMEKIANCRQNLYKARTGVYIDAKQIGKWSDEILKLNPDDVQATFYSIASKERWEELNKFVAGLNAREIDYCVPDFVDFLTNGRFVEECMLRMTDLIERAFQSGSKEYELCQTKIRKAAENERSGIFDEKLQRDVFVAYSSKDKAKAYELVEYLEKNGFSCFIAMRNLAKGVNAERLYNERLKSAIDNCRIFVLVSSRNSRSRSCDAFNIEMRYVRECDIKKSNDQNFATSRYELYLEKQRSKCKPRVEYLIEEYENGIYEQEVKKFFGGLTWQKTKDGVCKAVYDYIENGFEEEEGKGNNNPELQAVLDYVREQREKEKAEDRPGFELDNNGYGILVRYTGKGGDIVIPRNVSSIGENAFQDCDSVTSIKIPDTVTLIRDEAFKGCANLKKVEMANSVKKIGKWCFYDCSSLEEVQLSNDIKAIEDFAFYNCFSLKRIAIPNSATAIGNKAFYYCSNLTEVVFPPDSLLGIWESAFENCKKLKSVTIPNTVSIISKSAFLNCVGLERVEIPSSTYRIDVDAFKGCSNLTIYAEEKKKPDGWVQKLFGEKWNPDKRPVVWGHKEK